MKFLAFLGVGLTITSGSAFFLSSFFGSTLGSRFGGSIVSSRELFLGRGFSDGFLPRFLGVSVLGVSLTISSLVGVSTTGTSSFTSLSTTTIGVIGVSSTTTTGVIGVSSTTTTCFLGAVGFLVVAVVFLVEVVFLVVVFFVVVFVLDYISGMTDVFALDLYRKINGNSLPAV